MRFSDTPQLFERKSAPLSDAARIMRRLNLDGQLLGGLLLIRWRVLLVASLQLLVTAFYLAWLTIAAPDLWLDPLGALTKTLPLVIATFVMMAIEEER